MVEQTKSEPANSEAIATKVLVQKWGLAAIEAGYTVLPSIILKRQKKLGLDALDVNILLHLVAHWWKGSEMPYPSKATLAEAIGVDASTIRRRLKQLEAAKLLKREPRKGSNGVSKSNRYDLTGLVKQIKPYAEEELLEIKKRKEAKHASVASKKSPQLKVVK